MTILVAGSEPDGDPALGQQLGHRHAVEVGQLGQLLHGDRAVAALVGPDDDRLPAAAGLLLDAVQRQTLLLPDGAELAAERLRVVAHLAISSLYFVGRGTERVFWYCGDVPTLGAPSTGSQGGAPRFRGHPEDAEVQYGE